MIIRDIVRRAALLVVCGGLGAGTAAWATMDLETGEIVQASGVDLVVGGYSVPAWVDWNEDGLPDLVVGEGGGTVTAGKVRIYLNDGVLGAPAFTGFTYAQAAGVDLSWPASGCLGVFPRVVQWDGDGRKDLIVGLADGRVRLYTNIATNEAPAFDAGVFVACAGADLDVGSRATPTVVDWDDDGRKDLCVGGLDGCVRVYLNSGADPAPVFASVMVVQASGGDLVVPSGRSSPGCADLDGDGRKDLLLGNTDGQLLLYLNTGTDAAPLFSGFEAVTAGGLVIDLEGTPRSRPCLGNWNADAICDVLVGAGDGKIRLYRGQPSVPVAGDPPGAMRPMLAACPNPFNPRTSITIVLPRASAVGLAVYDAAGVRVRWLRGGMFAAGSHEFTWDGRDGAGRALPSGTYLLRLATVDGVVVGKVTLAR